MLPARSGTAAVIAMALFRLPAFRGDLLEQMTLEGHRAYIETMGDHRPARTVIGVSGLPKPGVLLTMNLTAVTRE